MKITEREKGISDFRLNIKFRVLISQFRFLYILSGSVDHVEDLEWLHRVVLHHHHPIHCQSERKQSCGQKNQIPRKISYIPITYYMIFHMKSRPFGVVRQHTWIHSSWAWPCGWSTRPEPGSDPARSEGACPQWHGGRCWSSHHLLLSRSLMHQ